MTPEQVHLREAAAAARRGDFQEVVRRLRAGRAEWPMSPGLAECLVVGLRHIGEWRQCARAAVEARRLGVTSVDGEIARAEALGRLGCEDEAREVFESLLRRSDVGGLQFADIARTAGVLEFDAVALEACRRILYEDPDDADALFGAAVYMERVGEPAVRVERTIRRSIKFAPGDKSRRAWLGLYLFRNRRLAEARAVLDELPDNAAACGCLRRVKAMLAIRGE